MSDEMKRVTDPHRPAAGAADSSCSNNPKATGTALRVFHLLLN